ncbi:hypothetical protein [Aquirufa lenticrescens]|uniref:hypothetical protein n=1 Tax=Aquirufa lenticrescens TaxID=2696560 RepID=UPI001CAA5C61|nr:hypothetical protein [Aquirufa lenticrescens]UAJ14830.1 hypothetical protein G9X62_09705 [Aquirufa lenticrescens]
MATKLVPPAGSISTFKNLGLIFQLMSVKFPVFEIWVPSPITTENMPWALVVTSLDSTYSTVPVSEPWMTEKRRLIF